VDTTQANQMLTWLDEEHRRDKALIVELRQKIDSQAVDIVDLNKRIIEMEGRLASTQAKLTKFTHIEQALQQLKDELVLMLRQHEESHVQTEREQVKVRQLERENVSRALAELRRGLEPIGPLQEKLSVLRAEDQRLGELVLDLQTRVTSVQREIVPLPDRITYLESQRGQDQRVVVQSQQEIVELMRRTEAHTSKIALVEEISRRNEQSINAIASFRDEIKREQVRLAEEVKLKEASRDRQMADWGAEVVRYSEAIDKQNRQIERFSQQQDIVQQHLIGLEKFKEQLVREQKVVSEAQKLAEGRQKRELEEFIAGDEQKWIKTHLEQEARWNQQLSKNEEFLTLVTNVEAVRRTDAERAQATAKELLVLQGELKGKFAELWRVHERAAAFHMDEVRHWYAEIAEVVRERIGE
jgi:hypothetical protein